MRKQSVCGYLVLEEGLPVRYRPDDDPAYCYNTWYPSRCPIALFPDRSAARRVKLLLRRRYSAFAARLNPNGDEAQARAHALWSARAANLRITAVVNHTPAADLRPLRNEETR